MLGNKKVRDDFHVQDGKIKVKFDIDDSEVTVEKDKVRKKVAKDAKDGKDTGPEKRVHPSDKSGAAFTYP